MALGRIPRPSPKGRRVPGPRGVTLIVMACILAGVGAGAMTTTLVTLLANPEPSPSPSGNLSPSATGDPVIPVDLYPPITRTINADDYNAGLTGLAIEAVGTRNLTVVPGEDEPEGEGPIHSIRVEIEEGLPLEPDALGSFVLNTLNDERGWGANGHMTFIRVEGAPDIRIVFVNPEMAGTICPRPHEAAPPPIAPPEASPDPSLGVSAGPVVVPTPAASPSPEPEASCAEDGIVVVNAYYWAAGLEVFGENRTEARAYLLNHFLGHVLGYPDATCTTSGERASVMVDHQFDIAPCLPSGWPNPSIS
jgi:hypothetical protein